MYRSALAIAALLVWVRPSGVAMAADPSPAPTTRPKATRVPTFSNQVQAHTNGSTVTSAECNRRSVGMTTPGGTMGPNGASQSKTLIVIPLGGASAAATRDRQIAEACAHIRR